MTVAIFIYQNLFCRYLAPGECIIHDRGPEFCNKVVMTLMDHFGVEIRIISAGRPQGNGQAEKYVDILKEKMKAIMAEISSQKKTFIFRFIFFVRAVCTRKTFLFYEAKSFQIIGIRLLCTLHLWGYVLTQAPLMVMHQVSYYSGENLCTR